MWELGDKHKAYGEVVAVKVIEGEAYRWFIKRGVVSMIPLSALVSGVAMDFSPISNVGGECSGDN